MVTHTNQADINKLNNVINNATRIIDCELQSLDNIYFAKISKKKKKILYKHNSELQRKLPTNEITLT